ncbi:MAG: type II toxin-antitoxin system VapC family toxin [Gammaproteobacteria bacterium]
MRKTHSTPSFVLDCSVTMSWCFEDEKTQYSEKILASLNGHVAKVPPLWPIEVSNVLLLTIRKQCISPLIAHQFKSALATLPIEIEEAATKRVFDTVFTLAQELKLTAYDATYLELAQREKIPLASLDKQLIHAAEKMNIPLFHP